MEITIVALPGASPASLAIARDAFRLVREQVDQSQGLRDSVGMVTPVRTLSLDGRPVRLADGRSAEIDGAIDDGMLPAAIHVAAFEAAGPELNDRLAAFAPVVRSLARAHDAGATISASGASIHLLAEAGLLSGSPMWAPGELPEAFRRRHPRLRGDDHGTVLDRGSVVASLGPANDVELMVRLVDRILSPVIAGWLSRAFGLRPLTGGSLSDDPLVADAQVWLGLRYADHPRLADLAAALSVSEQTLLRRFRSRLGTTPRDYVRTLRVSAARQQLEHSTRPVAQIAALVGYDDPKSFREAFRATTGMSASAYRAERRRG